MPFSPSNCPSWKVVRWFAALIAAAALAAGRAEAQQYKEMPAPVEAKTWPKVGTYPGKKDIEEMLKGNTGFDGVALEKYLTTIVYPHFTRSENFQSFVTRTDLPKMRRQCRTDYFNNAKAAQAHEKLNEVTLKFMDDVAQDNYDPAARANAMLMIADLSDTDPNGKPWKNALPVLLKGLTAQTTIDAVRLPALRGLVRHAQGGIDSGSRPQVMAAMFALLNESKPPADRSADGHDWMRRRAIDVLAAMSEPGENGAVVDALAKVIGDNSSAVSVRAAAAAALANPKLTPPQNIDATKLAKSIGAVGVDAYKSELAEAASQFKPIAADRLKQYFTELHTGLAGVGGKGGVVAMSKAAGVQQYVNSLVKEIDALQAACGTAPLTQPIPPMSTVISSGTPLIPIDTQAPLAKAITQAGGNLEAALGHTASAAAPEAAGGAPPG